jgi:hypothetical protein
MDQATSAHQAFFGHKRKRGEDANLMRRFHLRADCHRQKGAPPQCLSLHFITDMVSLIFEKPIISYALQPDTTRTIAPLTNNQMILFYFLTGH